MEKDTFYEKLEAITKLADDAFLKKVDANTLHGYVEKLSIYNKAGTMMGPASDSRLALEELSDKTIFDDLVDAVQTLIAVQKLRDYLKSGDLAVRILQMKFVTGLILHGGWWIHVYVDREKWISAC